MPFETEIRPDILMYAKAAALKVGYFAGQVEVTSVCGQKCFGCDSWRENLSGVTRGTWTLEQLQRLCKELDDEFPMFEHLSLTGGDPQDWAPLDEFLHWFEESKFNFKLQANTALIKPVQDPELWRRIFYDVRVSLDGATRRTYQLMRGDDRDPQEIVDRMDALQHPRMATNTCVSSKNLHEVAEIMELLSRMQHPIRKAMFLSLIGARDAKRDQDKEAFWVQYEELPRIARERFPNLPTSFQENVHEVSEFCNSEEAKAIPCYSSVSTFHLKADGDHYGCCLVGGEALLTRKEFVIGNFWNEHLRAIFDRSKAECHYGDPKKACSAICQFKQLSLNRAAHAASKNILAMP
jgi:MoaA/NifB/PqqE/SkfB family radical SAM enzyme